MNNSRSPKLFRRVLLVALLSSASLFAQTHVGQPAVNLGDTSFLDGIAGPGGVIEVIGDGAHDSKVVDGTGRTIPGADAVNSISELTHFAWITPKQIFGGSEQNSLLETAVGGDERHPPRSHRGC